MPKRRKTTDKSKTENPELDASSRMFASNNPDSRGYVPATQTVAHEPVEEETKGDKQVTTSAMQLHYS